MKKKNQNKKVKAAPAPVVETLTLTPHQEKRELLKQISSEVKPLVESGKFQTVNAAIINAVYRSSEHQTFKSFDEWKREGYSVLKGSKSFCIWGKPTQITKENEESYEFFPLAYLFSNAQVELSKKEVEQ